MTPEQIRKSYFDQLALWQKFGFDELPTFEEWLVAQYQHHLQEITGWRARWTRKTQRVHELERELAAARQQRDEGGAK